MSNSDKKAASLVKGAIYNPEENRHFMTISPISEIVSVKSFGVTVARSNEALCLKEVGYSIYPPVTYFPHDDVDWKLLESSEKTTYCPLKGHTKYFHLNIKDEKLFDVAWVYQKVIKEAQSIQGFVAFDLSRDIRIC